MSIVASTIQQVWSHRSSLNFISFNFILKNKIKPAEFSFSSCSSHTVAWKISAHRAMKMFFHELGIKRMSHQKNDQSVSWIAEVRKEEGKSARTKVVEKWENCWRPKVSESWKCWTGVGIRQPHFVLRLIHERFDWLQIFFTAPNQQQRDSSCSNYQPKKEYSRNCPM